MSFLYSLPNGKTIKVDTIDQLLNLDVQEALAKNIGYEVQNPFYQSSLTFKAEETEEDYLLFDIPELSDIEEIDIDEDF